MMRQLENRARAIARSVQRRRLEDVAHMMEARGFIADVRTDSVASRGRGLVRAWLVDPLLRFAGKA